MATVGTFVHVFLFLHVSNYAIKKTLVRKPGFLSISD